MTATIDDSELRDVWLSPVCVHCKHHAYKQGRTCPAFPDGIPAEIWRGDNPHTSPYPGDNGIRFEPVAPVAESAGPVQEDHWVTINGNHVLIKEPAPAIPADHVTDKGPRFASVMRGGPESHYGAVWNLDNPQFPYAADPDPRKYTKTLEWMTPEAFRDAQKAQFADFRDYYEGIDHENVDALRKAFESRKNTFATFVLEYDDAGAIVWNQEGRHRAEALVSLDRDGGVGQIPVWVLRQKGRLAESADDLDGLAALIAEADLAEAFDPTVPGKWVTLRDGRRVFIKDKGPMPHASVAGTVQATLGADRPKTKRAPPKTTTETPAVPGDPADYAPGATRSRDASDAAAPGLREAEARIRGEPVEHMVGYRPDGTKAWEYVGTKNEVRVQGPPGTEGQCRGGIVTHNHPSGKSFSAADIRQSIYPQYRQIRAIGADCVYVIEYTGTAGKRETFPDPEEISTLYEKHEADVGREVSAALRRKEIKASDFRKINTDARHEILVRVARDEPRIRYYREPLP
jgi:hypothetical protein